MKISNVLEAKKEAERFLKRIKELEASQGILTKKGAGDHTIGSKETAAVKRSSMDLTRSLSKMRNNIWD